MKFHGIQITEGANVANLTVASGTAFPSDANEGELFYRSDASITTKGLYLYVGGNWDRIASADSITAPSGSAFPGAANVGDLFYRDSNDSGEGLYVYNGATWIPAASGSGSTATATGDVTGVLTIGGSAPLTLATVNSNVGSFGSASSSVSLTVNAKGLVTAAASDPISIAGSQITSGTVPNAQISETSVTQHQSALSLAATQLTSGVLPDARVQQSNVTQHQAALTIAESQIADGAIFPRINGTETITGSYQFNNPVVVPTPSSGSHATSKDYVDQAIAGLSWKNSVRVATTANITLSGTQTIDGVVLSVGNRVLVKDQSTASQNGVYVVSASAWSRAVDFDSISPIDEINSAAVFVQFGTVNADTAWTQVSPVSLVGTDAITFTQFAGANTYIAGAGMTLSTNTFNVGTADSGRIVVNTDNIDLATVGTPVTAAFVKPTTDAYGRVTATTPVTTADVTSLVASEYLRLDGTVAMTGGLRISDGSVSAPGIRFADDLTTGIYAPNDFVVAITNQGVERFRVTSAGTAKFTGTSSFALNITSATPTTRVLRYQTNDLDRWGVGVNAASEAGSNAGSNFFIQRHNDAGAVIDAPFYIDRATGNITLTGNLGVGGTITAGVGGFIGAASLNVLKAGDTMTGNLSIVTDSPIFTLTGSVAAPTQVSNATTTGLGAYNFFRVNGVNRWVLGMSSAAESGSNVGSTFFIQRYSDAGAIIDVPLSINRASGFVSLTGGLSVGGAASAVGNFNAPTITTFASGVGYNTMKVGTASTTGFMEFISAGNVRQGYIGNSTSTSTLDTGTINYVAGTHAFTGNLTIENTRNFTINEGSESLVNIFRQAGTGGTVIANGMRYTGTANGFASSYSPTWARSAIALGSPSGAGSIGFYSDTASAVAAGTDVVPTLRMLITSAGNLGIGTATPIARLGVNGNAVISGTSPFMALAYNQGGTTPFYLQLEASGAGVIHNSGTGTNGVLRFLVGSGTEAVRIDASGNLGIGVASPSVRLDVNGAMQLRGGGGITLLNGDNTNYYFMQNAGITGAANPFLAFTQGGVGERMRLDSNGNFMIGTTTGLNTSSRFRVYSSTLQNTELYAVGNVCRLTIANDNNLNVIESNLGDLVFYRNSGGLTEAMRLSASGNNLGLGGAPNSNGAGWATFTANGSSGGAIEFNAGGTRYGQVLGNNSEVRISAIGASQVINFQTAGVNQRMTITSTGQIGMGGNTNGVAGGLSHALAINYPGGGTMYGIALKQATNTTVAMNFVSNSDAVIGSISTTATTTAYNTSSDVRLKKNIAPAASFGSVIDAIEVVSFDWKVDDSHQRTGFIAQDLYTVVPEAVRVGDSDPETITDTWAVDPSKLIPMLIKEIQELRARVAALENT